MRKLYYLTVIPALLLSSAAAQTEPTLSETTDWLTSICTTHGKTIETTAKTTDSERVENLRFENCTMFAVYIFESAMDSRTFLSVNQDVSVRLSDVERVEVGKKSNHWLITVHTKGKAIKGTIRMGLPGSYSRQPLATSQLILPCDDEDIANRIRKALTHAAALCIKQKEPF